MDRPEPQAEQGLGEADSHKRGVRLCGDEPPNGEEIGSLMRLFRRFLSLRFNHSSFAMSFKYIAKLFAFAVFAGLDGLLDGRVASGWSRKAAFGASR